MNKQPCLQLLNLIFLLAGSWGHLSIAETEPRPRIAIIIDDLGYTLSLGRETISLPHPMTLAIIPGSPYAVSLAEAANCGKQKEVMVHLPMTPENQVKWEAGLNGSLNKDKFTSLTATLIKSIPHAVGANNHGGSLLTQDKDRMMWLMGVLAQHSLFFIDSRTSPLTVAAQAAQVSQLPHGSRDIFLDNAKDEILIAKQLNKAISLARENGQAIVIGHPYPETLNVLREHLPRLSSLGIELTEASALLQLPGLITLSQNH